MYQGKFKIYDEKEKKLLSGTSYSITGDGDITGIVVFTEGAWWIENKKEQRAVPLFSETAIDRVIGDIYSKGEDINV